jgi:hypothetical protein
MKIQSYIARGKRSASNAKERFCMEIFLRAKQKEERRGIT